MYCSPTGLLFFPEVFESWLEAGLRWNGFFRAERPISSSEMVVEVYLAYNFWLAALDVSMSAYNNNIP